MQVKKNDKPGFWEIFSFFFGISALTIGGGYVMVPIIQRSLDKKGWMKEDEFYDLFALTQSVPGPLALNTALFTGRRLAGLQGYMASFFGILLPPFISVLLIAFVYDSIKNYKIVAGFLNGAFAVVPGLTASLAYKMVKKRKWNVKRAISTVLAVIALILSGKWAVPVFFCLAILAFFLEGRRK